MSFNIFPKNVIEGTNSDGKRFRAFEYDYSTFATLQLINLGAYLLVGSFFCVIASPIILVMLLLQFTDRFNIVYLSIPILSGYFIVDCAKGWLMSLLLNFFIEADTLVFLVKFHIACIVAITILTFFGKTIFKTIVSMTDDTFSRYFYLFVFVFFIFLLTMANIPKAINVEWLGITRIHHELGHF